MNFNRRPIIMKTSSFRPLKQRALTATTSKLAWSFHTRSDDILEPMQLMKADVLDYATDPIPFQIEESTEKTVIPRHEESFCTALLSFRCTWILGTQAACFGSMRMAYRSEWNRRSWFQCADRLQRPQWCPKGLWFNTATAYWEKIELDSDYLHRLQMIMA